LPEGCRQCVEGKKLVLFVGGKCPRACWYCSLSNNRKNSPKCFANERSVKRVKDLIDEAVSSRSLGCGITGGDPLYYFKQTMKYVKALRKKFGKRFHIHIYLPFPLVDEKKIRRLAKYVDEFRFHPGFLIDIKRASEDVKKLKLVNSIIGRKRMGIEMPVIPGLEKEMFAFIDKVKDLVSFVNLNEFEISDTNFKIVTKKYKLNGDTYTINGSLKAGLWILKQVKKGGSDLNMHLCTARTKNSHQYFKRLMRRKILPYGNRTDEGTVIYFAIYSNGKSLRRIARDISRITKKYYVDKIGKRVIINMDDVEYVWDDLSDKYKIARVEESPTHDREVMSFWHIGED
tara:strand:- start:14134 stop:15165 length:1032 start_codon:yes stop_codon:yes gene_type:complete